MRPGLQRLRGGHRSTQLGQAFFAQCFARDLPQDPHDRFGVREPKIMRQLALAHLGDPRARLDAIRQGLPDCEPYRAWSNFELIADDGSINEVDLLVFTPPGFFLVEIKSRPGVLAGDAVTWIWTHERREVAMDNPIFLANRKSKKLKALLSRQKACRDIRFPFIAACIFCSSAELD